MSEQGNGGTGHATIFTMVPTPLKFGRGASEEVGWEIKRLGASRVMLVSDAGVVKAGIAPRVQELIEAEGIEVELFDRSRVEPTADSFQEVADFAKEGSFDGIVAVGGGTSIDTAKVANLIAKHGGEIMDYVNPPIGDGRKLPGPVNPLVAIPTTAGTGSEATPAAVLDLPDLKVKTGISHEYLRPDRALVDPNLTMSMPREVTAATGLDVVCHAAESYTTGPFDSRPAPETPDDRPSYQGANPIADMWAEKALEYGGKYLRRAVADGRDVEARGHMMLGATLAGIGFGSAGVHIPHSCSYPISGFKHEYQPPASYPQDHKFIPHGYTVIVTSPAAFRFTYQANPERHHRVAELLGAKKIENPDENSLPDVIIQLMRDLGTPRGLKEFGYTEDDIEGLVEGTLKQQRLLVGTPREVTEDDLANILRESMENW